MVRFHKFQRKKAENLLYQQIGSLSVAEMYVGVRRLKLTEIVAFATALSVCLRFYLFTNRGNGLNLIMKTRIEQKKKGLIENRKMKKFCLKSSSTVLITNLYKKKNYIYNYRSLQALSRAVGKAIHLGLVLSFDWRPCDCLLVYL